MDDRMISVDRWSSGSQAYFLTHLHADHTAGLTPTWKWAPLFCSRVTAKLLPYKFPGFKLSLLRVLNVGHWYSLPLFSPTSGLPTTVQVMAIDAHHCPDGRMVCEFILQYKLCAAGAVMYLFRGEFGSMLFTGDFRWEKGSQRAQIARTMLLNALKGERLDILYIDNTYCNPSYCFPSREVAAKKIINIINAHPNHDIVIGADSLGKEDLLLYISRLLKIKIWVWPERLQTMHLLGLPDIFTTKTSLTRVRAIPRYSFTIETLQGLNEMRPTIGIMPSGLPWAAKTFKGKGNLFGGSSASCRNKSTLNINHPTCSKRSEESGNLADSLRSSEYIYTVPYSDHSCFAEIKEFVELLQPINVKGIVSSSPCYVDPLYYFAECCGKREESRRLCKNLPSKEEGEIIQATPINIHNIGVNYTLSGSKRRKKQPNHAGSHVSRVTLLRRANRGVKLSKTEGPVLHDCVRCP